MKIEEPTPSGPEAGKSLPDENRMQPILLDVGKVKLKQPSPLFLVPRRYVGIKCPL